MKIKITYIVLFLLLVFFVLKYLHFNKYTSRIEIRDEQPKIELEKLIKIDKQRIKYLKSIFYNEDLIGFSAVIDSQYITVTKLGIVANDFVILKLLKKPNNSNVIGLPPTDINDKISRYINFSSYPFSIKNIYFYSEGALLKSYDNNFSEFVFNASNIDILFNKKINQKEFGYVGAKQLTSISFINFRGILYIVNTHSDDKGAFKSLHDLSNTEVNGR